VDLDVAWQEWQVAEGAKLSVFRLVALESQMELADEAASALEGILKAVETAAASGEMSQGDLALARANFDVGKRNALALRQARDRERQALNALLGLTPHQQVELEKPLKSSRWQNAPSEQILTQNLDQRLDLLALQKGYDSQDARVRLAVWSQFPSIGLSVNRSRDTSNIVTQGYAVAVSLPFLNGGRGQVAIENATRQQLRDQYLARLYHARSDVAQLLGDLKAVKEMIVTAQGTLPALEAQARGSETAYGEGQMELLSYGQARIAWISQRAVLAALEGSLDELGVALEIASGRPLQESSR
jgi:outer membrane protein TolC